MSITGQPDGRPGAEPMKVGVAVSDLFTSLYSAIAILAALIHQTQTGEGQAIDMALFDCQAAALANQASNYLVGHTAPTRLGNAHPNIVPYQVFADGGRASHSAPSPMTVSSCASAAAANIAELAADPRFVTNADRVDHRDTIVALLKPVLAARSTADWIALLEAANVPCGPINTIGQVFADPQAMARGLTVSMAHAAAGPIDLVASPLRLTKTPPEYRSAPPILGQHTDDVLNGVLGLSPNEIKLFAFAGRCLTYRNQALAKCVEPVSEQVWLCARLSQFSFSSGRRSPRPPRIRHLLHRRRSSCSTSSEVRRRTSICPPRTPFSTAVRAAQTPKT